MRSGEINLETEEREIGRRGNKYFVNGATEIKKSKYEARNSEIRNRNKIINANTR